MPRLASASSIFPAYDNFQGRYSGFSESSYDGPSQIKIREKNLFITVFLFTISFPGSFFLKISTLIRNVEFHFFSPFYLDCLFKFGLRKTVEKCVKFVDYLVLCKTTTMRCFLRVKKRPIIAQGEIWRVQWMRRQFNIGVLEVFLHQWYSMGIHIILVQDSQVL